MSIEQTVRSTLNRSKRLTSAIAATVIALCTPGAVFPADLTITTGSTTGTYFKFGQNIADVARRYGVDIEVASSQGSVENIQRILGYSGLADTPGGQHSFFQLGLVQGDVLDAMRAHARGDQTLEAITDKIKVVLPLYGEEIHVLVDENSGYTDIEDFLRRGQNIGAGKQQSGTRQTVLSLWRQLGMQGNLDALAPMGGAEALEGIDFGVIEGMIYVAGAPTGLMRDSVTRGGGLRLISADMPRLYDLENSPYRSARITPETYPWLDRAVDTTAVVALLVVYDYDENNDNCALVEKTTRAIIENIDTLRQDGHPKWRDFDLRAARQRSDIYECAKRALVQQ